MLTISVILFAIAALGGVVLGATGILPGLALALFVVAALGGFVLFAFHLRGRQLPRGLIYMHGSLAVIAEVLLIIAIV